MGIRDRGPKIGSVVECSTFHVSGRFDRSTNPHHIRAFPSVGTVSGHSDEQDRGEKGGREDPRDPRAKEGSEDLQVGKDPPEPLVLPGTEDQMALQGNLLWFLRRICVITSFLLSPSLSSFQVSGTEKPRTDPVRLCRVGPRRTEEDPERPTRGEGRGGVEGKGTGDPSVVPVKISEGRAGGRGSRF